MLVISVVFCMILIEIIIYLFNKDTHKFKAQVYRLLKHERFAGIRQYEAKNEWGVEIRTKLEFGSTYVIHWGSTIEEAVTKALNAIGE